MSKSPIRTGLFTGATFAVILIFLALTGFTVTGAKLVAKILGNAPVGSQLPSIIYLVIFLALLGIWNGVSSTKVELGSKGLLSALVAGSVTGTAAVVIAIIFGALLAQQIDPRPYLSMVTPDSMNLFLLRLPLAIAALSLFILMVASSVLGGYLTVFLRTVHFRELASRKISAAVGKVTNFQWARALRGSPIAIYLIYAAAAIIMILLPRQWGSYWNYIIGTVGIYVILGLGLNIIVGLAGQLVLGYVAFFAIGAYTVAILTAPQPHGLTWDFWITLAVAIVLSAITGILLGLPVLRLRGDYLAIVTLGFGEIIRIMLRSEVLTPLTAGPKGIRDIAGPTLFGKAITSDVDFLYLILIAVIIMIFITNRLQNSRAGRAWVAIREDEVAAKATGINTFQSKLLALAIGAAFAGLGGALFASRNQFTGPEDHSLMVSINVLSLVIVGGMGSIPGIILGAFALKGLPEILRELENYRMLVFGGLLVVMMIMRPEGLWPPSSPHLERSNKTTPPSESETSSQPPETAQPATSSSSNPENNTGGSHANNP